MKYVVQITHHPEEPKQRRYDADIIVDGDCLSGRSGESPEQASRLCIADLLRYIASRILNDGEPLDEAISFEVKGP